MAAHPAYDLTFAKGHGWTSRHQMMRVRDLTQGIRETHLIETAEELGVTGEDVRRVQSELDARRRELRS